MANPNYRTKDEWFSLIQECRRSGMTDAQWCIANGVNHYSFYNAIKRLKACSYVIPSPHRSRDIHDLKDGWFDKIIWFPEEPEELIQ